MLKLRSETLVPRSEGFAVKKPTHHLNRADAKSVMFGFTNPAALVILNEVKNHYPKPSSRETDSSLRSE